jgi:hypothetical protein
MERPALLFLSATTVAISLLGFAVGRQSVGTTDTVRAPGVNSPAGELRRRSVREEEMADLSKVTIENLGQVEFEQAYRLLQAAPREVLSDWTKRLEALPAGPRKTAAITTFFKTFAQLDAKTAVDLALTLTRREPRATATSAINAATPASSLAEVARLLASVKLDKMSVPGSAIDLIAYWSCTDPVSTSQFVASHPEMSDETGLGILLGNWAALDPAAAKAWLDDLDASRKDPFVYRGFYSGWFEHDRPAALNHLIANAGDEKMNKAIEGAAYTLFSESPATARTFVLDLPEGQARKTAISKITIEAAGHFLRGSPSFSADAVAKWLFTLPADNWEDNLGSVVSKWSGEDSAAVAHWMNDMPTPTRDQVAAEFCLAFDSDDPQRSLAAGLKINDRQIRENTFREVFKKVGSKKRVRELLQRANLPPEQAAALERLMAQSS